MLLWCERKSNVPGWSLHGWRLSRYRYPWDAKERGWLTLAAIYLLESTDLILHRWTHHTLDLLVAVNPTNTIVVTTRRTFLIPTSRQQHTCKMYIALLLVSPRGVTLTVSFHLSWFHLPF